MDVRTVPYARQTLEAFAREHGLGMTARERAPHFAPNRRWYAHFDNAEVRTGEIGLTSVSGEGETPEEAIAAYGQLISGELLIVNAMDKNRRREIYVPTIVAD